MNVNLQRAVDRVVGVPLCALFSLIDSMRGRPPAASSPRRILVILLSEMGSLVLAQPMFASLRQCYPQASLYILVFAKNREVIDLLDVLPPENVITLSDASFSSFLSDSLDALRKLRSLKFDVVIDCELFARVSSIFSYLSGAPVRVGFHRHTQEGLYRGSFINRPVLYNPYCHLSRQFLTLASAIGSDTMPLAKSQPPAGTLKPPMLRFPEKELQRVIGQLHADFPAIQDKRLVLAYPSGGVLPIRAWPLESYRRLCAQLIGDGYAVGIIGLKEDKALGKDIVAQCRSPYCIDLTGYTVSVRHLLALFHRAALLVTNDGGPGHLAALTPVPVIVFFGPETPVLYGSLSDNAHFFYLQLSCSPCLTAYNHRTSPCDGDNQCLKQIAPERVLDQARKMLAGYKLR